MFVMGDKGTIQTLTYKGKLPVLKDLMENTYDRKNVYNFVGATAVHSLTKGTKFNDVYALNVSNDVKGYEGLLTDLDKIKQMGAHIVTTTEDMKVKLSYLIYR